MYRDRNEQARAHARSAAYYTTAGFPDLAQHYHPIDVSSLRTALAVANFDVLRLDEGRAGRLAWLAGRRHRHASFLEARLKPNTLSALRLTGLASTPKGMASRIAS